MNLSYFYTPLIFLALIAFIVNLINKKHSKTIYIISACVVISGLTLRYIQSAYGTETIGGFFENQKEYEANYTIEITPDGSTEAYTQKNITASIQRPDPTCSFLRLGCKRETLLVKAYTKPSATEFFPSYCILDISQPKNLCLDNHANSWNIKILSNKKQK